MWKEGFVLCVHSPQWLICTERDLDNQKQTVRSDGLAEWRAGSQNQKRKSMKTGRQWWTVNRLERIWRRSGWQSLPPPVITYSGVTTCQDVTIGRLQKGFLLSLAVTLWHAMPRCRRDKNTIWRLERGGRCPLVENVIVRLPLGPESRTEPPAGARETRSLPGGSRSAAFYSLRIGLCCRPL